MSDAAASVLACAVDGTALSRAETDFYRRVAPAGLTLFAWNIPEDHARTVDLVRALQATRPSGAPPLLVAIDQEGGRVRRFKAPFPNAGPAMTLAEGRDDLDALREVRGIAHDMGHRLRRHGVNVDFAPCCDIFTEPTNTAIGDRCFGASAESVSRRAGAFLAGLTDAGVLGCLKHFPGQGDAKVDTHVGGAVVDVPLDVLKARELAPFRALLPNAPMVMIAHCIYPALAPEEASRSPRVMIDLLRNEMGFGGVIVSDDMTMGAIPQDAQAWGDALVDAIAAGADLLLVCKHLERYVLAHEALKRAAARGWAFKARLDDAAARVTKLRAQLGPSS